jgi:hypothetical protein
MPIRRVGGRECLRLNRRSLLRPEPAGTAIQSTGHTTGRTGSRPGARTHTRRTAHRSDGRFEILEQFSLVCSRRSSRWRTRCRVAGCGRCAPEIGFRFASLTLARRVVADSSRHPLRGTKRQWYLTQPERVDGTRRADSLHPISRFAGCAACARSRHSASRPPDCVDDRAVSITAAWRLAKESVRGMPRADSDERARRLRGSGRLSPCASTGDPTGPRSYRPRSAFRRAEPLSGARCQTPTVRRDRATAL